MNPRHAIHAIRNGVDINSQSAYTRQNYRQLSRQLALRSLLDGLKDARTPVGDVLEIGSGSNGLLDRERLGGRTIWRSDIDESLLKAADSEHPYKTFDIATEPLPFGEGVLAAVVVSGIIDHMTDPPAMLQVVHDALGAGGVVVITTPNLATLQDRLRFLWGQPPRQLDYFHPRLKRHIRPFTRASLSQALEAADFVVEEVETDLLGWEWRPGQWLEFRWPAQFLPGLGGSLIARARKATA